MQKEDIEREKQQADEELAGLLSELVVKPIDQLLEERVSNELFNLECNIEENLKKQLTAVSKAKKLEEGFNGLGDNLEKVESRLRDEVAILKQQLVEKSDGVQASLLNSQLSLNALGGLLEAAFTKWNETSEQMQQKVTDLRPLLAGNEKVVAEHTVYLQAELKELSRLLSEQREAIRQDMSLAFEQQSSVSSQHVSSISTLLHKDLSTLDEQNDRAAANMLLVQEGMQQQRQLLEAQQTEIQYLRQSMQRIFWSLLIIGMLSFVAIVLVALQTPAILALMEMSP